MTEADAQALLGAAIRERLGDTMHNPVRIAGVTCRVCLAPLAGPGYEQCWRCDQHERRARGSGWQLADRVVPLTYSVEGEQSSLDFHQYKARTSGDVHFTSDAWHRLSLLVVAFGLSHVPCLDAVSRYPVSRLATVASLRGRCGPHPLSGLTAHLPRSWERVALEAADNVPEADRRQLDPRHFSVVDPDHVAGRHVVVLEDTWVQGGHAQSAAVAIRKAGAAEVTVLTVARRLSPTHPASHAFIEGRLRQRGYEPALCPVTSEDCPA